MPGGAPKVRYHEWPCPGQFVEGPFALRGRAGQGVAARTAARAWSFAPEHGPAGRRSGLLAPGTAATQDCCLDDPAVEALLCALRARAGADALPRDAGRLLYSLVRARRPGVTVDYGGAWPDTAIPLAAAVRDNGTGLAVCWAPGRPAASRARAWLERAGLAPWARVLGPFGDLAAALPGPLDLLVLRGRPAAWPSALELLEPVMRPGSQVVASERHGLPGAYAHQVRASGRYLSLALPIGDGLEVSSRLAGPSRADGPTRTDPGMSS
ncbi:O-methyltransferase [Streptomyces sp. NRRL F-5126]|uniref:O-methyltransferase n=1 Tax=Streptomyces sp. NRRL F-5126 TaxID=1463857 RepID=UPI000A401814|nr:hypothetical protein [Streptomyces sp. NRRL F-5126]